MRHAESELQKMCVRWFRLAHPLLASLLFAVPNGGARGKATAAIMKGEGVLPGVSDLILLVPNSEYHALCVEMKTVTGRQSEAQRNWQKAVEDAGYRYVVCRTFEGFAAEVGGYLERR